jgi:hypothetical protein
MRRLARALALICVSSVSLVAVSAATAVPPVIEIGVFTAFTDTTLCGFPIELSFSGNVRTTTHLNQENNPVRIVQTFPDFTVTFTHGDHTLSTRAPALGILKFNPDGSLDTFTFVGMNAAIALPGQGQLLLDAGRIVFDADGNIVSESGPHQVFGTGDPSAFCAFMA